MTLLIERFWYTSRSTIGQLYLNEADPAQTYQCDTLEDPVRADPNPATPANEAKVYGETAIPAGRYRLVLRKPDRDIWSPRNGRDLPETDGCLLHLLDVPGYTGIYLHAFNDPGESLGCIAPGTRDPGIPDWIGGSRAALTRLMRAVDEAAAVWLEIRDRPGATA